MPFLKLDDALIAMIDGHRETIEEFLMLAHCGTSIADADIMWDVPMQKGDAWDEEDAKVSHAIGFICGCAAAFDVTPLELLDTVKAVRDRANATARVVMSTQRQLMESHEKPSGTAGWRRLRTTSQRRAKLPKP